MDTLLIKLGLIGLGCILLFAAWLPFDAEMNNSLWLAQATALWAVVWWQAWRLRQCNRPHDGAQAYPSLGWANSLTLVRGGLIALAGGFLNQTLGLNADGSVSVKPIAPEISWIVGILYCVAAGLDRLDGWMARRNGRVSVLGVKLDTAYDALGLLVAPWLAVEWGKLHGSFLLISIAYYLFQLALKFREKTGKNIFPLLPSELRRTFAGFQMGFVGLMLLPPFQPPITQWLGVCFMVPMLFGFLFDWGVVSGKINADDAHVKRILQSLRQDGYRLALPLLRLLAAMSSFILALHFEAGLPAVLALFLLIGLASRTTALILLIYITLMPHQIPLHIITLIAVAANTGVLLFGSGPFSVWRNGDAWIEGRRTLVQKGSE